VLLGMLGIVVCSQDSESDAVKVSAQNKDPYATETAADRFAKSQQEFFLSEPDPKAQNPNARKLLSPHYGSRAQCMDVDSLFSF